jgi:hypothetical protein
MTCECRMLTKILNRANECSSNLKSCQRPIFSTPQFLNSSTLMHHIVLQIIHRNPRQIPDQRINRNVAQVPQEVDF